MLTASGIRLKGKVVKRCRYGCWSVETPSVSDRIGGVLMQSRFTKAEVDYVLAENKVIKDIPPPVVDGNYRVIKAGVYRKSNLTSPIKSLSVMARVALPVAGVPAALPSVALNWHGIRIRGIDHATRHDNPGGAFIQGWHEHLWSPEHGDAQVRAVPQPKHRDLRGILKEGLKRWNITVLKEQLEFKDL
jgi:hypothetical protein